MLFLLFVIIFVGIYLLAYITIVYSPKLELIELGHNYIMLLWYNKIDDNGYVRRKYIKLFEV